MTFAGQTPRAAAESQLRLFLEYTNHNVDNGTPTLDTARMYCHGRTEELLGDILEENPDMRQAFRIDSKVNAFQGYDESLAPSQGTNYVLIL